MNRIPNGKEKMTAQAPHIAETVAALTMYVRRSPLRIFTGMIVPTHDLGAFLELGFVLLDRHGCSGARMQPPVNIVGISDTREAADGP